MEWDTLLLTAFGGLRFKKLRVHKTNEYRSVCNL